MNYMTRYRFLAAVGMAVSLAHAEEPLITEHVLVTAPLHKTAAETAMPVTVLSGKELRDKAANTIGETLHFEPGIASSSFGPGVGQPVIRGQSGPRTTVIQNGIAIQDASSVSPDHANATEPLLAESIEVIRGPATLLYGSGTIGGVVNVIDNRIPDQPVEGAELGVEYRHNTVNDQNTGVAVLDAGDDKMALHFDGFYRRSNDVRIPGEAIDIPGTDPEENTDGYIANSDTEARGFTAGMSFIDEWGYIGASANRLSDNYGLPPGVHEEHDTGGDEGEHEDEFVRLDLDQSRFDIKSEIYHPAGWLEALRLHLVRNNYSHRELEGDEVGTRFDNEALNFRGEMVHHAVGGFHGALGLDYGDRNFSAVGEEAFISPSDIRNLGLFLLEDIHTENWSVELGLRLEHQRIEPEDEGLESTTHRPVSVSVSGLWSVTQRDNMSFSLSRSQRAPAVEELYSNATNLESGDLVVHAATGSVEIGDTELDLETSWNAEIGWRHVAARFDAGVNLFYNRFSDYIYLHNTGLIFDPVAEGAPVYQYEQQPATFRGLELDMSFTLLERMGHELDLDIFGDYIRATLDDTDQDVPRLPPARLGTQLNFSVGRIWTYVRAFHNFEQDNPGENETSTDAYTRVDAAIYFKTPAGKGEFTVFLKGNNLSNAEIRNSTSFLRDYAPEPGRGAELGLRYSL